MIVKYALTAALVLGFAGAALAADGSQFVIIKDKNKHCRIIEQNMVSEDQLDDADRQAGLSEPRGSQYRREGALRQFVEALDAPPDLGGVRILQAYAFAKTRIGRNPGPRRSDCGRHPVIRRCRRVPLSLTQ